ncbi:MAG: methyltransferase regulatory domain-containing protein [Phycisphaerae bacterium]
MSVMTEPSGSSPLAPTPSAALTEPEKVANTYDAIPYSVNAFPQTHPDRLAIIATLFGLNPAPPDQCRVLELGCAAGGNLIPMALLHPNSKFVGIDLSARQIAEGQGYTSQLGLKNLDLQHLSILDITEAFGKFDYILAHGVYSWVPPEVQDHLLTICAKNLAPRGVAYVSYNTYPGWHARGAIREMLWYHTEQFPEPQERIRQARGLLAFLASSLLNQENSGGLAGYSALVRQELALLLRTPDTYLLHEHLEEYNEPLYFHQFAGRAAAKGLQYLGEAQVSAMMATKFGAETEQTLRQLSPDLLHMEQYMDFLRNRMFRQTLLCHDDIQLDHTLRPETVKDFYVASSAKPVAEKPDITSDQPADFVSVGLPKLTTHDPLMKAAMVHLAQLWPRSIPFAELLSAARGRLTQPPATTDEQTLATRLLNCYVSQLVDFSLAAPKFTLQISPLPVASPWARLRAGMDTKVTTLRLESLNLSEPSRLILRHLDGTHDRAALTALLAAWIAEHPPKSEADAQPAASPETLAAQYVEQVLPIFAQGALLIG